ncbi:MAG: ThiF family adenylyltransferase [Gammaproteobacteria bacterium]|jgi:molybdopterin-synthase adenylyltransferase|nr:ThiF family adenylyltransferase [Gammaproteobacteria bacterium]
MKLRVLESQWTKFAQALCTRSDVESAGLILAERLSGGTVLYARHLIPIPEDGYSIRKIDQIRIDPVALNRLVRPARDGSLSVLTAHTHPGSTRPWFSSADDAGDSRLIPSLFAQMPGPHGSIVIAGKTAIPRARGWNAVGSKSEMPMHIIGKTLRVVPNAAQIDEQPWYDRQRLALGEEGQRTLQSLHIAIVGLGGTGSVAFVQLAHLGIRQITLVDGDRVERSNVSRILGATSGDAGHTWKVDVAARYAERLGLNTKVAAIRGNLGIDVSPADIEGCDIVMCCVDSHLPRALLNRLAYEKAIPTIDMGSGFRVGSSGSVIAGAGRVVVVGPGRRCLACWGHIDPDRIRIETLSPADRNRLAADGYITGATVQQPSVVSFNTMIAGTAVTELIRIATRYAGAEDPPMRLCFDFENGTVRRNVLSETPLCMICLPSGPPHERPDLTG